MKEFYFKENCSSVLKIESLTVYARNKKRLSVNRTVRKLTIVKQHDVSTTSCHHCQMNKLEFPWQIRMLDL